MNANGALNLAPPAKQTTEREVSFQGLVVDLDHAHEHFQRLVGLLIQ